jgi:hypothetical protein
MSIEVLSYDANLAHQEKATAISHFNSSAMPIDIHPVASMDSPYTSLSPTAITQDILGSSSSSSSLDSSWSDPTPYDDQVFSSVPNVAGQGQSYPTCMSQKSWDDWQGSVSQSWGPGSDGIFVTPPGLGVNASTTYVRLGQGDHGDIYWDSFPQHTVPKRQKCERPAVQLIGQGGSDRRFTCPVENCGKSFSGEWEKTRHINSIHRPPTIGCRECNYKQSRKDLFSEHCRKRHPGRSIDDMMIQLDMPSE